MTHKIFPQKILLAVTGSIAAYKSPELVRLLIQSQAEVRVVLTQAGSSFVTPMTLQALSGHPVYQTLLDVDNEATMSHIDLARWADVILIAPTTAHVIAKLAAGFCDDLLTTLCLATTAPVLIAPAMNTKMWMNVITQNNIQRLKARGVIVLGPAVGLQACGEEGEGRMLEPQEIVDELKRFTQRACRLQGKKVLITAGPTRENIDPVRYISNYSSGKMGYELAVAAQAEGADVTLVSGPTALECPLGVNRIDVVSAQDMFGAVMAHVHNQSIFIAAAAVSDYTIKKQCHKLKKTSESLQLEFTLNPDILATVAALTPRPLTIGFAAETEHLLEHAKKKLRTKKLDMIIANMVGDNKAFQSDYNAVTVITQNDSYELGYAPKKEIAKEVIHRIIQLLGSSA